ncbi:MAG: 4-hydroxy-tetrahydrodipicolinate synthase [Pseudomonadota bacterium]
MLEQILWTACVTPFNQDGSKIDYKSFEKILRMQDETGNGVVIFGSTGESLSLTENEKKEMLDFVFKLGLKTKIVLGAPSHNLTEALNWIDYCNNLPIHGYLFTTPIYTKPGIMGQTDWFKQILDKSRYPAILYNIPGRAGIKLHPEAVKNLENHKNFLAIKDCGGCADSIISYRIASKKVQVYCGDDYILPTMATDGAIGLISIAANAWPSITRKYTQYCLDGGRLPSKLWWQACSALFTASNPIPIKALLKDIGIIEHDTVRLPLSIQDLPSRKTLFNYHEKILNWDPKQEV